MQYRSVLKIISRICNSVLKSQKCRKTCNMESHAIYLKRFEPLLMQCPRGRPVKNTLSSSARVSANRCSGFVRLPAS
jgi:hypothetical protein